jgi:hypothetical protein
MVKQLRDRLFCVLIWNSQRTTLTPKPILIILLFCSTATYSQLSVDSISNKIDPDKLSAAVEKRLDKLEDKIISKSQKSLQRLQKREERIYEKQLSSKDSVEAKLKLAEIQGKYNELKEKLRNPSAFDPSSIKQYIPHLDTINSALKFLSQNNTTANVRRALAMIESFHGRLQQAEDIKDFIRQRRELLQQELEQLGLVKELKKFNKEVYYYSEQLKEYKEIIRDPNKIEKKAIELLSQTKVFQDFMRRNSMLASLFRLPGDPNDPALMASLSGLQTRTQVNSFIQQQVATGGPNAQSQLQQNIQQGQSQMQQLKNKLMQLGGGSSDDIMPQGFKPNNQKTKSFLKRLEYGTNIQAQRSTNFFPATTDLGLSLGYKLNDKSIIGVGAAYKIGLGHGWDHMELSSQGAGLRSYVDWKLQRPWLDAGRQP